MIWVSEECHSHKGRLKKWFKERKTIKFVFNQSILLPFHDDPR